MLLAAIPYAISAGNGEENKTVARPIPCVCLQVNGGWRDFFPGVSVFRRTIRRSRTELITLASSRPSRSPWKPLGRFRLFRQT